MDVLSYKTLRNYIPLNSPQWLTSHYIFLEWIVSIFFCRWLLPEIRQSVASLRNLFSLTYLREEICTFRLLISWCVYSCCLFLCLSLVLRIKAETLLCGTQVFQNKRQTLVCDCKMFQHWTLCLPCLRTNIRKAVSWLRLDQLLDS